MIDFIPIIATGYFVYFFKQNHLNHIFTGLIFLSYFMFSTNYTNFGFDFDVFRYLHRGIGMLVIISLFVYIYRGRVNVFKEQVSIFLGLFFLTLLLSSIGNDIYMPHYVHYIRNFIFIALIVIYLYCSLDSQDKVEELFKLIVAMTSLLALFVMIDFLTYTFGYCENCTGYGRSKLFYSNPNYLAYALLLGLVLAIFSKIKYKNLIAPLIIFSIFATSSKAAVLSAVFVIIIFIWMHLKSLNKAFLFSGVLITTLFLTIFFDKVIINPNYNNVRFVLAEVSLNAFSSSPLNGIGYGQFRTKYYQYIDANIIELLGNNSIKNEVTDGLISHDKNIPEKVLESMGLVRNIELMTHNDLFTIATELGLVGLAFVVFLFHKLYFELKKLLLYSRNNYFVSISLIGSSLIFSLFHNNLTSFVFWFILFVPFIMNRNYKKID